MSSLLSPFYGCFFFLILPPPRRFTLFPYTTLFRSPGNGPGLGGLSGMFGNGGGTRPISEHDLRASRLMQIRSEEHTSELQSRSDLVCRLLLEKKKHDQ